MTLSAHTAFLNQPANSAIASARRGPDSGRTHGQFASPVDVQWEWVDVAGQETVQQLLLPGSIDLGPQNLDRFMDASADALDLPGAGFRRVWPKASGHPGSSSGMQRSRNLNDRPALLPLPLRQLASHSTSTPPGPRDAQQSVPAAARSARWTIMRDKHRLREDLLAVVVSTPDRRSPVVFAEVGRIAVRSCLSFQTGAQLRCP